MDFSGSAGGTVPEPEAPPPEAPPREAPDVEAERLRSIVPRVVDGWRRQGRPVDLVLDEPDPDPDPDSVPVVPVAAPPPPAHRSLGGTPTPWARSGTPSTPIPERRPGDGAERGSPTRVPPASRTPSVGEGDGDPADVADAADGRRAAGRASAATRTRSEPSPAPDDVVESRADTAYLPVPAAPIGPPVEPADGSIDGAFPADGPLVARDPTALGPSLPRRAGSLVRRWVTRVVSFLKRLPRRLGLRGDPGADADGD